MNTQHLDLLTKACDEIVAAKEAIANAENKIAYIREQIQQITNTTTPKSQSETKITKYSDFPQPRASRVKEILASGVSKAQEPAQQGESKESNTQTYTNNEIGGMQVETIDRNGIVFFKLTDIEKVLGLSGGASRQWVKDSWFDADEIHSVRNSHGGSNSNFVAESGLYRILNRTNSPKAKPFERWVTKEVLPSIRKTGSYQSNNQDTLKRYEALFGGKFSVQTPCKQFIMQNIAQAEAKHNAIATELVSYNYTEEFKKGKAKISSKIGLVYDRPVAIDKKPIITKRYLPNEMLRENQSSITANAESNTKIRKR